MDPLGRSVGRCARPRALSTEDLAQLNSFFVSNVYVGLHPAPPFGQEPGGGLGGGGPILACQPQLTVSQNRLIEALMGVFRQQKALDRLEDRLQRTEQLCADLDRENKKLDLEFTDLYDKVRRQMSRMAKRYAVDSKELPDLTPPITDGEDQDPRDPISEAIHARRSRGFLQP